jgi:hypothetical protein
MTDPLLDWEALRSAVEARLSADNTPRPAADPLFERLMRELMSEGLRPEE